MPESRLRGWWYLLSTTLVMAGLYALGWQPLAWPLRVAVAVLAGLVTVREFILYHDYMHGAFLRGSRLARAILYPLGVFVMTPPRVWRETHNYHHNHTAQLVGSHIGSFATMTTQQWAEATPRQRAYYKLVRHPIYFGWVLVVFGTPHMTGDRLAFAVMTTAYLVVAVPFEERSLARSFGEAYARYQRDVKWRMIPFIY